MLVFARLKSWTGVRCFCGVEAADSIKNAVVLTLVDLMWLSDDYDRSIAEAIKFTRYIPEAKNEGFTPGLLV